MRILLVATLLFFNVALALWHAKGGAEFSGAAGDRALTQPGIPTLVLWSERRAPTAPDPASATAPAAPAERTPEPQALPTTAPGDSDPPPAAAALCGRIGPFASEDRAAAAAAPLADRGWRAEAVAEALVDTRYWVLLPPLGSSGEAFQIERALREAGVRDLQVLTGDGRDNAISLGLYRERATAERRLEQIRRLGYRPELDLLERRRAQFWVRFRAPGDPAPSAAEARALLPARDGPALELRPCPRGGDA